MFFKSFYIGKYNKQIIINILIPTYYNIKKLIY